MKIAVHSDLHTEVSRCELADLDRSDILLLAGDIGDKNSLPIFYESIRKSSARLPVYYVLGNHDRYGYSRSEGVAMHRHLAAKYDVHILDNESLIVEDILIAGTTLWTDFELANDPLASMFWAETVLPDFKQISADNGMLLTTKMMRDWCFESLEFLNRALKIEARKKVVVSHFLPAVEIVATKHRKNEEEFIHSAYWASNFPDIYALADFWIYGHSHTNIECQIGKTRLISNQRGYSRIFNKSGSHGYQNNRIIEV